jgi:hypothetical protein
MISVRGRDRTRRFLLLGLLLSLLVHLIGGSFFGLISRELNKIIPLASKQSTEVVKTDVIHLERAAPPPVARRRPPPPPPAPVLAQRPIPAPRLERPELFHQSNHGPHVPPPSRGTGAVEEPHVVSPAAGPSAPAKPYYSDQQLAELNGTFAKAIADAHQTLAQVNAAMQNVPVVTTKHFEMHYNGIHEGLNPGDGIISPTKVERRGNTMWYYTHYIYMYGDGHVEEDDIPWPFHYPVNDDPFARGDRRIPLQPPPAGYVPDRPLKPQLMQFFGGPIVN